MISAGLRIKQRKLSSNFDQVLADCTPGAGEQHRVAAVNISSVGGVNQAYYRQCRADAKSTAQDLSI
jgi:hypothetical protein